MKDIKELNFMDGLDGVLYDLRVETYLLRLVMEKTHNDLSVSSVEYDAIFTLSDSISDSVKSLECGCEKGIFGD